MNFVTSDRYHAEWPADAELDAFIKAGSVAADAAAQIARSYFRSALTAAEKVDESPVTEADRRIELTLAKSLSEAFPDHGIWGEEFGRVRPDADFVWVLDPIDGTRAFITGRPLFGTLIGLLYRGRPILGILDQPLLCERWIGCAGRTTMFEGPLGGAIGARACPSLDQAELSCTAPEMLNDKEYDRWRGLAGSVRRTSWGGDCYAYGLLALGLIDIVAEAGLKIWDWAAIEPIVVGAGGLMTDWNGQTLRADGDGRVLALGNPNLLADALARLG